MSLQGTFRAGKRQGRWRAWHQYAALQSEGVYDDDRKTGPWTWWDEDGRVSTPILRVP